MPRLPAPVRLSSGGHVDHYWQRLLEHAPLLPEQQSVSVWQASPESEQRQNPLEHRSVEQSLFCVQAASTEA